MISTLQTNFHVKPKKFKKSSGITTKMKFKFFKKKQFTEKTPTSIKQNKQKHWNKEKNR